jgi:hypothetical protein
MARGGSLRRGLRAAALAGGLPLAAACGEDEAPWTTVEVNSLEDLAEPPAGTVTLRSAVAGASGRTWITFAPPLDGGTIELVLVGEAHSILKGEVYAPGFVGYQERDYGRSALYARGDLAIDASALPNGIAIVWAGELPARVLAVYGDLTATNVTIASGHARAEPIDDPAQPQTLGRGGGLAVWGTATLRDCTVSGNRAEGDLGPSRDRGAYGGGIYANGLSLEDCVVAGNVAVGYGAAGGGIYSVGGADNPRGRGSDASLFATTVSGNRVTGQHAYGGGIFSLAGGPANLAWMHVENCTVARNLVEDHEGVAGGGYYRGGGIYLGGGSLSLLASTVAENEVHGVEAVPGGNRSGGGWFGLSRKHYPKAGDVDGVAIGEVVSPDEIQRHGTIVSAGVDAGAPAVLWYPPAGAAVDAIPAAGYPVDQVLAQYAPYGSGEDDFLNHVLEKLRTEHGYALGEFGDMTGVTFHGPARTWPTNLDNKPWVDFWRALDVALGDGLGTVKLGDEFWGPFSPGLLGNAELEVARATGTVRPPATDQRGGSRPSGDRADVGAIER